MNNSRHHENGNPRHRPFLYFLIFSTAAGLLFATAALVHIDVENLMVRGDKIVARASSCLQGPRVFSLANLFDNDSATSWIEGEADSVSGRWLDVTWQEKKRFRGIVFGMGCRKDYQSLAEFGVATGLRIKLDEKEAMDRRLAWEWGRDGLVYDGLNMDKIVVWFDSDTAYTTAQMRIKFTSVASGRRYINMALSDMEPIDAFDNRFELLRVLVSRSFNPNDLGAVYARAVPGDPSEPALIGRIAGDVIASAGTQSGAELAAALDTALAAPREPVTDNETITKFVSTFRSLLVSGPDAPRFVFDGRKAFYLLPVGSFGRGRPRIDVWRSISTERTSRGLEVKVGYIAFVN
jgi:hypothetical protein